MAAVLFVSFIQVFIFKYVNTKIQSMIEFCITIHLLDYISILIHMKII